MQRRVLPLSLACLLGCALMPTCAADASGKQQDNVIFDAYTPLASSEVLLQRLVTPLNARRLLQQAKTTRTSIREQPIDLTQERFALYVPAQAPPSGYALLVFVPPWNDAKVPPSWIPALEHLGVILVTPANAGNDANVLDRRVPLALLAAANVMSRYRIDPRRVYVGGFSGGSRVALRLALGYPDLFHGALLDAGSDVVGEQVPLPSREQLEQFQTSTRIVYLTGERDAARLDADRQSRQSLKTWCVTDVDVRTMPWSAHELADGSAFERALASLDHHKAPDPATLASCRARIVAELDAQLDDADALLAHGDRERARRRLEQIDAHLGGLAAPRSVELMQRLDATAPK
ncbi:MAG TPA: PHB depolymerase family esterase [Dyella sp.]|uniref:PHB depolymerase family esterase n=1 Tax=Dyella sp. TaxID=1869338 RepID=UPI002D76ABA6|nr:PHB depolymerase family esterase [Dyella sp.]HET6555029.1 PHB depolymerase family esterase [Dyella sp.]